MSDENVIHSVRLLYEGTLRKMKMILAILWVQLGLIAVILIKLYR